MRCVRCFRPLTSERSIGNGMQGSTCRKYIGTMAPSGRAEMYQSFQMRMDKHGEVSQCSKVDYSHLSKGGYNVVTSLYDRDENELIISYVNKNTGEVTSVRFYAEEGKAMYDYEKGEVIQNVEIGSVWDEEISRQDTPIQEMRNDFVSIQSGEAETKVDLRADAKDLYQQYKYYETAKGAKVTIDHVNFSPADKSYSLAFTTEDNVPVKVKVFAKKGKSMGVTPVHYRLEKNGEIYEGLASNNDTKWASLRKEHDILNNVHFDARDSISNEVDMAFTKHKVKWLQNQQPNRSIDKTNQYKGLERNVNVKVAYVHPDTNDTVLIMETEEGQQVIRLYKVENVSNGERPYCYSIHGNGTVEEGKIGDFHLRYYQEQLRTVNLLVKNFQFNSN